jgi:uncharacterized membrane protein
MQTLKLILKYLMAIFYIGSGVNHFIHPDFYLKIMPPYLPWHLALVNLSGGIEIALGILLLIPRTTRLAAWGIILLLIAIFPANLYMAMNPALFPDVKPPVLYIRLPLQAVLIAWAYWYAKPNIATARSRYS